MKEMQKKIDSFAHILDRIDKKLEIYPKQANQ